MDGLLHINGKILDPDDMTEIDPPQTNWTIWFRREVGRNKLTEPEIKWYDIKATSRGQKNMGLIQIHIKIYIYFEN